MRTTYGSPLFADHVPERDSLLVERLRAAGALIIGKTNTPEFGAGSQTFNAVFGVTRNPYDLAQDARRVERRRGGGGGRRDAAVRRRLRPRRERPQPGGVLQPRRPAARRPAGFPDHGPGDPWNPLPVLGPIARTPPTSRCSSAASAGPDPRDPLSIAGAVAGAGPRAVTRAACGSPGAATSAGCRSSPTVTDGARARPRARWRTSAASSRTPSRTSPAPTSASRCCAGSSFAARVRRDRRPASSRRWPRTSASGMALTPPGSRARSRCAASCSPACASSWSATTCSPRRSRRSRRSPSRSSTRREIAGVADGLLPRVVPLLLADHGHVASRDGRAGGLHRATGCRSGCSSSAATAARPTCCGSPARTRGDGLRSGPCPGRLAPSRRTAPRTPTPSRARSGASTPAAGARR